MPGSQTDHGDVTLDKGVGHSVVWKPLQEEDHLRTLKHSKAVDILEACGRKPWMQGGWVYWVC